MRFLLAVPLLLLALAPPANAQAADTLTLTVGALHGTVTDDNQAVVPYMGNATVDVTVQVGCVAILKAIGGTNDPGLDHVDVEAVNPPSWLVAEAQDVTFDATACVTGGGSGSVTATGTFAFGVTAAAPGVTTQSINLTASLEGDGGTSNAAQVLFAVQFHQDYDVAPSVQFPFTVTGKTAEFTVTITNRANARSMVMVEELHASTGSVSGLGSVVYQPPETKTFNVQFKAPDKCWQTAKVDFKTFSHYLLLDQRAGSYKGERQYTWDFTNGVACTPGKDTTSKASPLGGWVLIVSVLGAAFVARRRL